MACTPASAALAIGSDVLVGPCQLRCVNILGEGSFSKVWRVRDLATGGPDLALKDQFCRSQDELDRSILECSILSEIHRGSLAGTHSAGACARGDAARRRLADEDRDDTDFRSSG